MVPHGVLPAELVCGKRLEEDGTMSVGRGRMDRHGGAVQRHVARSLPQRIGDGAAKRRHLEKILNRLLSDAERSPRDRRKSGCEHRRLSHLELERRGRARCRGGGHRPSALLRRRRAPSERPMRVEPPISSLALERYVEATEQRVVGPSYLEPEDVIHLPLKL